jgi:hypothetical protein
MIAVPPAGLDMVTGTGVKGSFFGAQEEGAEDRSEERTWTSSSKAQCA